MGNTHHLNSMETILKTWTKVFDLSAEDYISNFSGNDEDVKIWSRFSNESLAEFRYFKCYLYK